MSQAFVHPANKRTLLSLDGKSSMVVYDSAELDSAVECAVDGCFYANDQVYKNFKNIYLEISLKNLLFNVFNFIWLVQIKINIKVLY